MPAPSRSVDHRGGSAPTARTVENARYVPAQGADRVDQVPGVRAVHRRGAGARAAAELRASLHVEDRALRAPSVADRPRTAPGRRIIAMGSVAIASCDGRGIDWPDQRRQVDGRTGLLRRDRRRRHRLGRDRARLHRRRRRVRLLRRRSGLRGAWHRRTWLFDALGFRFILWMALVAFLLAIALLLMGPPGYPASGRAAEAKGQR